MPVVPYIPPRSRSNSVHSRSDYDTDDGSSRSQKLAAVEVQSVAKWSRQMEDDPVAMLAQTVLSRSSMKDVLIQRQTEIHAQPVFNVAITKVDKTIANQLQSGRCWLFATTNVCRTFVSRRYKLDDFQLSQSYLWYADHIEKANWFLEQIIDLAEEPLDDRSVQYLLATTEAQDGGQYDMAVNLIEKWGLVPQAIYPESFNSSFSGQVDALITTKLREFALELRMEYNKSLQDQKPKYAKRNARFLKQTQMAEIVKILQICSGTPPLPNATFTWEFLDKNDKFQSITTTPLQFAQEHLGDYHPSEGVPLVHDPRHTPGMIMSVPRLGNVVGGRPVKYISAKIDELKRAAIDAISNNYPVWFGCDVTKAAGSKSGILDLNLYDYDGAFGATARMNKKERLMTGDSLLTHAMTLEAVHLDGQGLPVRWKVENSWGDKACKKGYFIMSDAWFTEYVYQVVVIRDFVPKRYLDLYDNPNTPITELPVYDPMGALAGKFGSDDDDGDSAAAYL